MFDALVSMEVVAVVVAKDSLAGRPRPFLTRRRDGEKNGAGKAALKDGKWRTANSIVTVLRVDGRRTAEQS